MLTWVLLYIILGGKHYQEVGENLNGTTEDTGDISLVTGQVRAMPGWASSSRSIPTSGALALKGDSAVSTILAAGSEFLTKRSWQGLEQNLGQNEPVLASKGRSGVPQNYDTDVDTIAET
jgi:hypothetical protein